MVLKTLEIEIKLILSTQQMFQRFSIAQTQVKTGSKTEILPSEIRQVVYSLFQAKEIVNKVYDINIQ